ncbi:MAG: response regulator [Gammaproteobacteria bacterium]|jgi:signal transduction histidine kinase|nr:response regulator [Gammaproteobacteria bacterium]MBT7309034.1 response regulator [Gammaproteobacteria bacterium]
MIPHSDSFLDGGESEEIEWVIDTTTSGQEGVAMIEAAEVEDDPYAVIYLDMRMPGGWSGLETARYIHQADRNVRIIVITAFVDENVKGIRDILGDRFVYLRKPYVDNELQQLTRFLAADWARSQELDQAMRQLESLNQGKDQFLAMMSHELHDPLAVLLLNGEMLANSEINAEQKQLLQVMERSGKRVLQRINDILDSSKLNTGRLEITRDLFSLADMLDELEYLFSGMAAEAGLELQVSSRLNSSKLRVGDEHRIMRILANLLSNCISFTKRGGIQLQVTESKQHEVCFRITCSEFGIAQSLIDRFFTNSDPLNQPQHGIGLGFSVSMKLADRMGGSLQVVEGEQPHTHFELRLPLEEENVLQQLTPTPEEELSALEHRFRGTVLLIEGRSEQQALIRQQLSSLGVEVTIANSGDEGVESALSEECDLLLVDLQVAELGGMEAVDLLRRVGYTTPIAALASDEVEGRRLMLTGAELDGFLTLPVERLALMRMLAKYLPLEEEAQAELQNLTLDKQLIALYLERLIELKNDLHHAIEKGDWDALWKATVILLGSGTSFGFPEITRLAKQVRKSLKSEEYVETVLVAEALEDEVGRIIDQHA